MTTDHSLRDARLVFYKDVIDQVDRILGDRPHVCAPLDQPERPPLAQLLQGLATLAAEGVPLRTERLYHGRAVRRLNAIGAQLAALDVANAPTFLINGLKREELLAANSMILHELCFEMLGGDGGEPQGPLADAMGRDFGSVARWKAEFSAVGKALGGGSGWVLLTYSPRDGRLVNTWAADHTMTLAAGRPLLAPCSRRDRLPAPSPRIRTRDRAHRRGG